MRRYLLTISIIFIYIILVESEIIKAQTATLEPTLSLIDIAGVKVPYQNGMPVPSFEKQNTRTIIDLSGEWKKQRFAADDNLTMSKRDASGITALETEANGRQLSSYDDSNWEIKNLPGVENALTEATAPNGAYPEFYNDGIWYRKSFNIDAANSGKFVKLMFYAVNYVCDVWINGTYVGYHEGGYTPFAFNVSSLINYSSTNTIAIRVDNIAWGARKDIIPFNTVDWFNWAGVIHDIYLEISETSSVARVNIIPKDLDGNFETTVILSNNKNANAEVTMDVEVFEANVNQNNIQSEFAKDLVGTQSVLSGSTQNTLTINPNAASVWKTNLKISNPKLWAMKSPNLYVMKVTLTSGALILDEYYTQFGIRTVATSKGKFIFNNRIMFLPGVARHEEHPDYGRSVPKNIIYSDLVTIKNLNALYLRTAHYPNHLYTYLIADRLGIAIMEEIPVWQWDAPDVWDIQNSRQLHTQMFREMVFKDYNRPSVIMWSTSNECHLEGGGRLDFYNNIKNDYRTNYNDGRLLTQSAAADKPGAADVTQDPLDVAGWTIYFGIFYGRSGQYLGPTYTFVNDAKTAFPNKPILDTEFGYWSSENGSSASEQVNVFNQTFSAFKYNTPYDAAGIENQSGNLMGTTWWCVFDWYQYKAKKNGWQTMGLISMDRTTEKSIAATLRSSYLPYANKDGLVVSVRENPTEKLPTEFRLEQNYPNPFNPSTVIKWQLSVGSFVTLKVYNLLGKEVATLVNEFKQAGVYNSQFSIQNMPAGKQGSKLSSGVYFYRLQAGNFVQTKKMLLIK